MNDCEKQRQVIIDREETCSCGEPGKTRVDNGLPAGVHCDECWNKLVTDARKQSW